MKNHNVKTKNKGFTLIETLVAITILMISIVGPLTIASKSLKASLYARDNITATYLAQDGLEYIKNLRDFNIINSTESSSDDFWLTNLINCRLNSPCSVDTSDPAFTLNNNNNGIGSCGVINPCLLTIADGRYGYGGSIKTQFTRKFWLENSSSGNPDERVVTVEVSWQNGSVKSVVSTKSNIFKIVR